jgi:hypothetical protein
MEKPPVLETNDLATAKFYSSPKCKGCRGTGVVCLFLGKYRYERPCSCALVQWLKAMETYVANRPVENKAPEAEAPGDL